MELWTQTWPQTRCCYIWAIQLLSNFDYIARYVNKFFVSAFFFVLNTKCQNKSGRLWIRGPVGICCLSAKHTALRRKNGWHGIGIMRQECSDMSIHSELVLYKNPTKCAGLVHHRHHHHLIEMQFVLVIIWLKSYLLGVKQQSHSVTFSEKHTSTE